MNVIEIDRLTKTIRGNDLFEEASADFAEGEAHGVIGPNGSGKSVLFKLICGFMLPTSGEIRIAERFKPKTVRYPREFGVVVDRPAYHPDLSAADNLRRLAAINGKIGDRQISATLERVGLSFTSTQKARNFSLGMKQKLGLAQAVMEDQQVLLLDEPFNALDVESVERVREMLLEAKSEGKTILFTGHHAEDITLIADRVLRIDRGRLDVVR